MKKCAHSPVGIGDVRAWLEAGARVALYIRQASTAQLNLFGSHDITIAATLAGLQLARFTEADWISYLTGLAMVERDGVWSNHWFV